MWVSYERNDFPSKLCKTLLSKTKLLIKNINYVDPKMIRFSLFIEDIAIL